jgi:hypothetical protein
VAEIENVAVLGNGLCQRRCLRAAYGVVSQQNDRIEISLDCNTGREMFQEIGNAGLAFNANRGSTRNLGQSCMRNSNAAGKENDRNIRIAAP